jgi:hypothetical protein
VGVTPEWHVWGTGLGERRRLLAHKQNTLHNIFSLDTLRTQPRPARAAVTVFSHGNASFHIGALLSPSVAPPPLYTPHKDVQGPRDKEKSEFLAIVTGRLRTHKHQRKGGALQRPCCACGATGCIGARGWPGGAMQTRTEQATKYTYNPFDQEWHSYPCRVVVEKRPFAEGGMRCCLRMYELEENGGLMPVCLPLARPARCRAMQSACTSRRRWAPN